MQDNLKFKPRYEESETYQKVQDEYNIHEKDLFNYLLQTYPEQAIEIQETDGDGNPITIYNEDIILLLALLAKLFGGTREIIEDLQYAYDIDYLTNQEEKSNTDNLDNLLILLANEMQFTFLNDDNQETKIADIKEKKRFLQQYFISKRFRGTFLAIELILNAFKEYQSKKGLPFEYKDLSKGTVTTIKILTGGEGFIDPNHTVSRTVLDEDNEVKTYLSLNQNHFLYKMITSIKPAGFTYNIILDYLVDAIVVDGERIIADDEDNTFAAPKIEVSIKRTPGGNAVTDTHNGDSYEIEEPQIGVYEDYDFEYWEVNEVRYEGTWPITVTTDTYIEAIFYKKKDIVVEFYNTGTEPATEVSSGIVKTSRTTDESPEYNVSFTIQGLGLDLGNIAEPSGQSFIGWVEAGDDQIIQTTQTFTKTYEDEPTAPLRFNTLFEISGDSAIPPELIKSEARVISPMNENLDFYLSFQNDNSFPVDLYIETNYAVSVGSPVRVLENIGRDGGTGETTFRISYTDMSKPGTGRFFAYFKPTNSNVNSRYTHVNKEWWTMVGDYRTPGILNVQTRIEDTQSITYGTAVPRYAYLSKITVDDHRDWRNPTHRLKLYGDTINLGKNRTEPYTTYLFNDSNNLTPNIVLESYVSNISITTTSITNQTINRNPSSPVRVMPDLKPEYYTTGFDSFTQTWWVNVGLKARWQGALTPFDEDVLYLTMVRGSYYHPRTVGYGIMPKGTTSTVATIQTNKVAPTSGELKMSTLVISIGYPTELILSDVELLDLDATTGP